MIYRNIRTWLSLEAPASADEIYAAAEQFVRKISGFTRPSQVNEAACSTAVEDVAAVARKLIFSLETTSPSRNREVEVTKPWAHAAKSFGRTGSASA